MKQDVLYIPSGKVFRFRDFKGLTPLIPTICASDYIMSEENKHEPEDSIEKLITAIVERQYITELYDYAEIPRKIKLVREEFEIVEL